MQKRIIHLAAIVLMALALRLFMALYSPWYSGMSRGYLGACYMLGAGYGYNRPEIDQWHRFKREIAAYSVELSRDGEQIDPEHRPWTDVKQLRPLHFRMPGFPAFLLVVYRLFGEPLEIHAKVVQAFLTALCPVIVFYIVLKLFQRSGPAYGAAWLTALYPPMAHASITVLPSGLSMAVLLLAILCWVHATTKPSYRWMTIAGLLIAASCYFRPNSMMLWGVMGLAMLIRQRGWLRPILSTVILAGAIYAGMLPWALRNYVVSGRLLWGSTGTGMTVWKGIGQYENPWGIRHHDPYSQRIAREQGFECDLTPDANTWFIQQVKRHVRERPGYFVKAAFKRLPWILAPPFGTGYVNPYRTKGMFSDFREEEGLSPRQVLTKYPGYVVRAFWERILTMLISGIGSLSMVLLVFLKWPQRRDVVMLLAVPVCLMVVYACTIFVARYLTPIIPFQMAALAMVVNEIIRRRRGKEAEGSRNDPIVTGSDQDCISAGELSAD